MKIYEENLIRFPMTVGLTGHALHKRKIIISNVGDRDGKFSSEVDNFTNVFKIHNIMIGPIEDMEGNVRGVI